MTPCTKAPPRRWLRPVLMLLGPLLVAAIGALSLARDRASSVSTDNAYVQQDKVSISSDVNGRVAEVLVRESQAVKKGDVLIRIAPRPFQIALDQANAAVAEARMQVAGLREGTIGKDADVVGKREAVAFARIDLQRQQDLLKKGFTTRARLQIAEHALSQAESDLAGALSAAASARTAANYGPAPIRWFSPRWRSATGRRSTWRAPSSAPLPMASPARPTRSRSAR